MSIFNSSYSPGRNSYSRLSQVYLCVCAGASLTGLSERIYGRSLWNHTGKASLLQNKPPTSKSSSTSSKFQDFTYVNICTIITSKLGTFYNFMTIYVTRSYWFGGSWCVSFINLLQIHTFKPGHKTPHFFHTSTSTSTSTILFLSNWTLTACMNLSLKFIKSSSLRSGQEIGG